jgi:hypothetical protein
MMFSACRFMQCYFDIVVRRCKTLVILTSVIRGRSSSAPEEIEQKMDELARNYVESHDKEIVEEFYRVDRELENLEKLEKQ